MVQSLWRDDGRFGCRIETREQLQIHYERLDWNIHATVVEWTVWTVQAQCHFLLDYINLTSSPMKDTIQASWPT
ncbi:unnamed protein product [Trifolium pratense]|uniref:Uncharacterized protein n=1 Tax=Trifolium pratense TaxID=57577 RepID=A0ACB0L184_TRIPR|nr:unnamed protein product [Trifolium pratense]